MRGLSLLQVQEMGVGMGCGPTTNLKKICNKWPELQIRDQPSETWNKDNHFVSQNQAARRISNNHPFPRGFTAGCQLPGLESAL